MCRVCVCVCVCVYSDVCVCVDVNNGAAMPHAEERFDKDSLHHPSNRFVCVCVCILMCVCVCVCLYSDIHKLNAKNIPTYIHTCLHTPQARIHIRHTIQHQVLHVTSLTQRHA